MKKGFPFLMLLMASPGWSAYTYSRSITIDHTKVSTFTATYTNMPVLFTTSLVSLSTRTANGGHVANTNGFDIAFSTKDIACSYLLNWDTETYNAATGAINVWVKVPSISSTTDTTLYLCYGDSGVTSYRGVSTNTWDANYAGVWHLPNGTSLSALDSTSNGDNGSINGPTAVTGMIDGAATYVAGSNNEITSSNLNFAAATWETWAYVSDYSSEGGLGRRIMHQSDSGGANEINFYVDPTGGGKIGYYVYGASSYAFSFETGVEPVNTWIHLAGTYDGSAGYFYVNGVMVSSATQATPAGAATNGLWMGRLNTAVSTGGKFNGSIDEARISNIARSAGWVQTEYNNQNSPNTFVTIGPEVPGASGGMMVIFP